MPIFYWISRVKQLTFKSRFGIFVLVSTRKGRVLISKGWERMESQKGGALMLTDRQKQILSVIVDDYIRSAEPVGSRTISKRGDVKYSPATIRNEMSDLEEMGYLSQPHTSAGRIPSNKGYRFYVDHLIKPKKLDKNDIQYIQSVFAQQYEEVEEMIKQVASMLAELTNYTAIVLGSDIFETKLKHMQLIPLNPESAVAIIVTNTGHVEHRKIYVRQDLPLGEMERLVRLINEKLVGVPLANLREKLYTEIAAELQKHFDHYQQALHIIEQSLQREKDERVYFGGRTKIFSQPEFRDVDKVKELFELLEQHDRISEILTYNRDTPDEIQVRIGPENKDQAVANCSIITATYTVGGKVMGTLSILGPTRMNYSKVISILDYIKKDLDQSLHRLYENS